MAHHIRRRGLCTGTVSIIRSVGCCGHCCAECADRMDINWSRQTKGVSRVINKYKVVKLVVEDTLAVVVPETLVVVVEDTLVLVIDTLVRY